MSYPQYSSPQRAGGGGYGNPDPMFYQDQNQRPAHNRTRSKSSFSFRSAKSDKSSGSKGKTDLIETEEQKRRHQFQPAAISNPNRAISEAQPAVRALQEQATLQPLREVEHKDWQTGAVITDPDASNPSRSRLERPLDTIRSFEAAADHGFMQRNPPTRTESHDGMTGYSTRRSSMFGAPDGTPNPRYAQPYGYDTRRSSMVRQNYDYGRGPPSSYPRRGGMGPRMSSAPNYNRPQYEYQGPYDNYNYRGSHDTVQTGESSGSQSEPWANSTDPSSENSSIDRMHASKQNDQNGDAYGGNYGRRSASPFRMPIAEETWQDQRNYQGGQNDDYYYQNVAPNHYHPPQQQQQQQQQRLPNGPVRNPYPQRVPPSDPPQNLANVNGTRANFNKQQEYWQSQQRPKQLSQPPPQPRMQPMQGDPRQGKLSKQRLDKPMPTPPTEKKKSWLKRTFSKS